MLLAVAQNRSLPGAGNYSPADVMSHIMSHMSHLMSHVIKDSLAALGCNWFIPAWSKRKRGEGGEGGEGEGEKRMCNSKGAMQAPK